MFLLGAAQGIRKADGHYSGWRAAKAYDIIFICQEKYLPRCGMSLETGIPSTQTDGRRGRSSG